jgi:hypothetical protein
MRAQSDPCNTVLRDAKSRRSVLRPIWVTGGNCYNVR